MFRFVTHLSPITAVPYWFTQYGSIYNEPDYVIIDEVGNTYSIATTSDYTAGGVDLLLIKTGNNGEVVWAKSMGNVLSEDSGGTMCFDLQGNVCLAASVLYRNIPHLFVCKVTPSGSVVWSKAIKDATDWYSCSGNSIVCDSNNDLLATGNATTAEDEISGDAYLIKLNSDGDIIWQTSIAIPDWGYGASIAVDSMNSVYMLSQQSSNGSVPAFPNGSILLTKFSPTGSALWSRAIGFVQPGYTDFNYPAGLTVNGGYVYLTGEITNNADVNGDSPRGLVMKVDASNGDTMWTRVFYARAVYNNISYSNGSVHVVWNSSTTTPINTVMTLSDAGIVDQAKSISFSNHPDLYITSATKITDYVYITGTGVIDQNADFTNGVVGKIPVDNIANGTYGIYTVQDTVVVEDPLAIINTTHTPVYATPNLGQAGLFVNVYDVAVTGLTAVGDLISVKYMQNNWVYYPAGAVGVDSAGDRYVIGQVYDPATYGSVLAAIKINSATNTTAWVQVLTSVLPYGGWEPAGQFVHIVDSGSNILFGVTGKEENGTTDRDWFVCKHSTAGTGVWQTKLSTPSFETTAALLSDGVGAFVVGDVYNLAIGLNSIEIVHLDSNGGVVWHSQFADTDSVYTNGISFTNTESYTALGLQCNATNTSAVALVDNTGQLLWCYDIENSLAVHLTSVNVRDVCLDDLNNTYVCLYYQDLSSAIIKIDVTGNLVWQVDLGANEYWVSHAITWDTGYVYISGEYAIVKLDATNGSAVWKKAIHEQTAVNILSKQGVVYINTNARYFNDCAGLKDANISDGVGTSITLTSHPLTSGTGILDVSTTTLPFVDDVNGDLVVTSTDIKNGITSITTQITV